MNKIYETNAYAKEAATSVTTCIIEGEKIYITLADTIFFPEEGGQYADTGLITYNDKSVKVLDGNYNKETGEIRYLVDAEVEPGSQVNCELDYDIRYERMQCHSGEHVLTGVIHNNYGFDNVGFHLSDDGPVTLDINGKLDYDQVLKMEKEANEVIYRNLPIVDSYPTKEELKDISYRSKIEIDGQVRLITVGEGEDIVDICACCAPHVKRTGEIGIIKVIGLVNWKGGVRISMLAGRRALDYINKEHDVIRNLTGAMTTSYDNLLNVFESKNTEIGELKAKLAKSLESGILTMVEGGDCDSQRFEGILKDEEKGEENQVLLIFTDGEFPANSMKNLYNTITDKRVGFVGLFAGDDENGYRYFAGSRDKDSRILAKIFKEKFDAKGGGNDMMIQGQLKVTKDDICKLF